MTLVNAYSHQTFTLQLLAIPPTLKGAEHKFKFEGRDVLIKIPTHETKPSITHFQSGLYCNSWRTDGKGNKIPSRYNVLSVGVFIEIGGPLDIPEKALAEPPRHDEWFPPDQVAELDKLNALHRQLANAAIHHWIEVLRWKAKAPRIGEAAITDGALGWGLHLHNKEDGHAFWNENQVIVAQLNPLVTNEHWDSAQAALTQGKSPPVWFGPIFEAIRHLNNEQKQAAVLSAAIGLEVLMRQLVVRHLPENQQDALVLRLLDLSNLRSIINHRKKMKLWSQEWEDNFDNSRFNELMDCRDAIMHRADLSLLACGDWRKTFAALQRFAYFAEEFGLA